MPTKPTLTKDVKELNSASALNAIKNESSQNYQNLVPNAVTNGQRLADGRIATNDDAIASLRAIGSVVLQNPSIRNEFEYALINRIARVIITSRLYSNPWSFFKKGIIEYGETIEEIFIGMAQGYQFDMEDAENTLFKTYNNDVKSAFHSINFKKFYPCTISDVQLRTAFLSYESLSDFLERLISQVFTGANYDEFMIMKWMLARIALDGNITSLSIPELTSTNAKNITTNLIALARNLNYVSSNYNRAHVPNYTDLKFLYLVLTTDITSLLDVEVLAFAFNSSKAELLGRQVGVDNFWEYDEKRMALLFQDDPYTNYVAFTTEEKEKLKSLVGFMFDENYLMIFDNLIQMEEAHNGKGLYRNYFYHVWKTFSTSPFANAIAITTTDNVIQTVEVNPSEITLKKGVQYAFSVNVTGTGFVSKNVVWEITGNTSPKTRITYDGVLTISGKEESTSIIVTATSVVDSTKSGTCTVTVE